MTAPLINTQATQKLPQKASLYLWSFETFDLLEQLLKKVGADPEAVPQVNALVFQLCEEQVTPEIFLKELASKLKLDEAHAKDLTRNIATEILLKIHDVLPMSVQAMLGGDRGDSPPERPNDIRAFGRAGGNKGVRGDRGGKGSEIPDEEIEQIAPEQMLAIAALPTSDIPAIVKNICEHPAFQFLDSQLQDRCAKIVESRLREVRDAAGTRAQFEKSIEQGGLNLTGRKLSDLIAALEAQVDAYQTASEKDQALKKAAQQNAARDSQDAKTQIAEREKKVLSKRYVELTGKSPKESVAPVAPTGARVSSALSVSQALERQEARIDTQKVRSVIEASKPTQPLSRPIGNPSMQEVAFEKRLAGPIEELSRMTLLDFRRLSRDPQQAATKVKDKVDLLEEQGMDKKIAAIKAWRSSPINQLYLGLMRDAVLKGVPAAQLLASPNASDTEKLTEEELKVLIELNGQLRF